jgi:AraC-like DNA-binding protein/mannose-6-phosphate isomerase-like protein (cupin superfamily)
MQIPRYIFSAVAPGAAFHAAHATIPTEGFAEVRHHCHDFFEWIVVIRGSTPHWINGQWTVLGENSLTLIRPSDVHAILPQVGDLIELINIAFPTNVWQDFVTATGLQEQAADWEHSAGPITINLLPDQSIFLQHHALAAYRSFHQTPTRLTFSPFWNAAAAALAGSGHNFGKRSAQPIWLRAAIQWAETRNSEDITLSSLVQVSGVSGAHLSRSMKQHFGVTPTQFINNLRIKQAAYQIAATEKEIASIAFDCGFESLSYFYRRFQNMYGKTPKAYRQDSWKPLRP